MNFPPFRVPGDKPSEGKCTLRIRSRVEDGYPITQVFAVLADGSEVEVEDCVAAEWKYNGPSELTTASLQLFGTPIDADAQIVHATFLPGQRIIHEPSKTDVAGDLPSAVSAADADTTTPHRGEDET